MKKFLITLLLFSSCLLAKAQLTSGKWKGDMTVPQPTSVILDFKKDKLVIYFADSGQIVETMSYTAKNDTLYIKKVDGMSPCETGSIFKLKYTITADKLTLDPLSDDCNERLRAWTNEPFIKLKE